MGMRTSVRLRGAEAPSHEGEAQYAGRFSDNPHASTMKGLALRRAFSVISVISVVNNARGRVAQLVRACA